MKKPIYVVDAFTGEALRGNAAAVVLDCADLDDKTLQRIAAEMKHAETAFLLPARDPAASFHLRWFTPTNEVIFCGHATLASIRVLVDELGRVRVPAGGGTVHTAFTSKAGLLRVELARSEDKRLHVGFETPASRFAETMVSVELLAALGLVPEVLEPSQAPRKSLNATTTERGNVYVCLRDRESLSRARVDARTLEEAAKAEGFGGVVLYTLAPRPGCDAAVRAFFPEDGVPEDAATGSAAGQLALILQETRPEVMPRRLVFTQGAEMGRESRIEALVRPEPTPGEIRAWVGGEGVVVLRGELDLRALKKAAK